MVIEKMHAQHRLGFLSGFLTLLAGGPSAGSAALLGASSRGRLKKANKIRHSTDHQTGNNIDRKSGRDGQVPHLPGLLGRGTRTEDEVAEGFLADTSETEAGAGRPCDLYSRLSVTFNKERADARAEDAVSAMARERSVVAALGLEAPGDHRCRGWRKPGAVYSVREGWIDEIKLQQKQKREGDNEKRVLLLDRHLGGTRSAPPGSNWGQSYSWDPEGGWECLPDGPKAAELPLPAFLRSGPSAPYPSSTSVGASIPESSAEKELPRTISLADRIGPSELVRCPQPREVSLSQSVGSRMEKTGRWGRTRASSQAARATSSSLIPAETVEHEFGERPLDVDDRPSGFVLGTTSAPAGSSTDRFVSSRHSTLKRPAIHPRHVAAGAASHCASPASSNTRDFEGGRGVTAASRPETTAARPSTTTSVVPAQDFLFPPGLVPGDLAAPSRPSLDQRRHVELPAGFDHRRFGLQLADLLERDITTGTGTTRMNLGLPQGHPLSSCVWRL